ncbi:MAG: hypothetical protein AAGI23_10280 [Bacteroidota bacterium]
MQITYTNRQAEFQTAAATLLARYDRLTWVRLITFVAGLALIILLWSWIWWVGILATGLFLYGFYRFVLWHQTLKKEATHLETLSKINQLEQQALTHDFTVFEDGAEFIDPLHSYVLDLDIFGPYSLFQYINRTTTVLGKHRLANILKNSASLPQIEARQTAITALAPLLDWRQHFQAYSQRTKDEQSHIDLLEKWLESPPLVLPNQLYKASLVIAPILAAIALILAFISPWFIAILPLLFAAYILRQSGLAINDIHRQTTHAEAALAHYADLMQHIEQQHFTTPLLQENARVFQVGDAYNQVKRLSYLISQLNVRYNPFAFILNITGLWDLQWVYRLEKWKVKNRELLPKWFEALANFEALASLANLHYNQPEWIFPTFHEQPLLDAKNLGHPLISSDVRVPNDFSSPTQGHIKLITGSNMAGKSTFLRTVGINIVLANIGAPVCATAMQLPLLNVYTSMRTQDALHESTSSFYAELKRLKFIIEAVNRGEPIYFLLDEILKGTNSRDRHTGSKALIRQLIAAAGGGIIATHDLELGILEAQYDGAVENLRIEVTIKDGQLDFDYKLKKGVSESFNATILMQQMGIEIEA